MKHSLKSTGESFQETVSKQTSNYYKKWNLESVMTRDEFDKEVARIIKEMSAWYPADPEKAKKEALCYLFAFFCCLRDETCKVRPEDWKLIKCYREATELATEALGRKPCLDEVWEKMQTIAPDHNLNGRTITRRKAERIQRLDAVKFTQQSLIDLCPDLFPTYVPPHTNGYEEDDAWLLKRELFARAIEEILTEKQRQVVLLELAGQTINQIATALKTSFLQVKALIHRAHKAIREFIEKEVNFRTLCEKYSLKRPRLAGALASVLLVALLVFSGARPNVPSFRVMVEACNLAGVVNRTPQFAPSADRHSLLATAQATDCDDKRGNGAAAQFVCNPPNGISLRNASCRDGALAETRTSAVVSEIGIPSLANVTPVVLLSNVKLTNLLVMVDELDGVIATRNLTDQHQSEFTHLADAVTILARTYEGDYSADATGGQIILNSRSLPIEITVNPTSSRLFVTTCNTDDLNWSYVSESELRANQELEIFPIKSTCIETEINPAGIVVWKDVTLTNLLVMVDELDGVIATRSLTDQHQSEFTHLADAVTILAKNVNPSSLASFVMTYNTGDMNWSCASPFYISEKQTIHGTTGKQDITETECAAAACLLTFTKRRKRDVSIEMDTYSADKHPSLFELYRQEKGLLRKAKQRRIQRHTNECLLCEVRLEFLRDTEALVSQWAQALELRKA